MDIIKSLPHNEEAEKNIIGILLQKNLIGDIIAENLLCADDFYSKQLKVIFEQMLKMYDANEPIDIVTLSEKLKGTPILDGKEVLYLKAAWTSVTSTRNFKQHCKVIKDCALRRKYILQAEKIQASAASAENLSDVEKCIDELVNNENHFAEMHTIGDFLMPIYTRLADKNANKGQIPGHKTGFPSIDVFTGGLINGNMIVVAARPGMGKSILGNNIAEFTAFHEDEPAIIFTLEMTSEEVVQRIISSQSKINYSHIQFQTMQNDDFELFGTVSNSLSNKNLYIYDEPYTPLSKIRSLARGVKKKHGKIGVVVIDYLQLIDMGSDENKNFNRNNEVSKISRGLKLLAKELDCPVVVLSQLSRENEKRNEKRPFLSDLRDSGAIEQDADMVIFLHRDDYYKKENRDGIAEIIIAKNRHGKTGTVKLSWQPQIMRLMELSEVEKIRKQRKGKKNES